MQVFMSHNEEDKQFVEKIGLFLKSQGMEVWIDKWKMTPGDSLIAKIGDAIDDSDKLVAFLSPASVDSNWVKQELATGKIIELAEEKGVGVKFIIPVLLKPCKVPWFLRDKLYANFTDKDFDTACEELRRGILSETLEPDDVETDNEYFIVYDSIPIDGNKFCTIVEFGVVISPVEDSKIGISCSDIIRGYDHWMNPPNNPFPKPNFRNFMNKNIQIKNCELALSFSSPSITSTKSLYVQIVTDTQLDPNKVEAGFFD